ncbi:phosphoglycerate mutase-like protein [Pluteus cervinus]|uniref:Phosphoglycerate mutase-like protein n=1 Tax=Pluteus cervinus TaxID=181527 RepID=A0ACD3A5J3_9AGAR|nr:phosphoglycerate mutase-like protein [Pluteus cervinus]
MSTSASSSDFEADVQRQPLDARVPFTHAEAPEPTVVLPSLPHQNGKPITGSPVPEAQNHPRLLPPYVPPRNYASIATSNGHAPEYTPPFTQRSPFFGPLTPSNSSEASSSTTKHWAYSIDPYAISRVRRPAWLITATNPPKSPFWSRKSVWISAAMFFLSVFLAFVVPSISRKDVVAFSRSTIGLAMVQVALLRSWIPGASAQSFDFAPKYYPPASNDLNNFTVVLDGHGAPGIFNSSLTKPEDYGVYNWCNMPHVRKREYIQPPKEYQLEYVEIIHRHHKRTPYSSNTFFKEGIKWDCDGVGPLYGGVFPRGAGHVQWQAVQDPNNPFSSTMAPGFINSTCQFPQITPEGLKDSVVHGTDLKTVYFPLLNLPKAFDPSLFSFRVTNNVITSQIASALLQGLFPGIDNSRVPPVSIQPSNIDSLEPTYSCPKANSIRNDYTTGSQGSVWLDHLTKTASLYGKLDKVSGINPSDSGWHASFDHYYDNMSAKQCHDKTFPCSTSDSSLCVPQDDANTVYRIGNWEYNYIYRTAPQSAAYAALRFGGWMLELKARLLSKVAPHGKQPSNKIKYAHNVAHDGSISALLGFLQVERMVWPGMGSEVVFELYSKSSSSPPPPPPNNPHHGNGLSAQTDSTDSQAPSASSTDSSSTTSSSTASTSSDVSRYFVRVLWNGQPMLTSTPLALLDMIPLNDFLNYISGMVGSDLLAACNS